MKKLLSLICIVLMTACGSSEREQKLADEVLELKTAQIQREADQKIEDLRDGFDSQLAGLKQSNLRHQQEMADAASIINGLRKENEALKRQLNEKDAEVTDPDKDDSKGPISIVGKGESIVINPANSGGNRYLLVDIYLIRANEKDKSFKSAIDTNSKKLQSLTMDKLSEHDIQELSNPSVRKQIENDLKKQYQTILGSEHPIKELVVTRWIMQ